MGGNALAPFGARRVDKDTAAAVAEHMHRVLADIAAKYGAYYQCSLIPAYFEKQDFGDLDFIIDSKFADKVSHEDLLLELERAFGASIPSRQDGPVFSVGIPLDGGGCLQVDLIETPSAITQSSIDYYSWNDLGNLVGIIAKSFGFKYGHAGLAIMLLDGTHMFAELSISTKTKDILTFLGYDFSRWEKGFNSREEIFQFVVSSRFFNKDIYLLENRNHSARTRDKKRPTYTAFLKWLEKHPGGLTHFEFETDVSKNLSRLFYYFPETKIAYDQAHQDLEDGKYLKKRFNAAVVSRVTGRNHIILGEFMDYFRRLHWKKLESIRVMSDGEIEQLIRNVENEILHNVNPNSI